MSVAFNNTCFNNTCAWDLYKFLHNYSSRPYRIQNVFPWNIFPSYIIVRWNNSSAFTHSEYPFASRSNRFQSSDEVICDRCPKKYRGRKNVEERERKSVFVKISECFAGDYACNVLARRFTVTGWAPRLSDIEIFTLRVLRRNGTETPPITLISILELATAPFLVRASIHKY